MFPDRTAYFRFCHSELQVEATILLPVCILSLDVHPSSLYHSGLDAREGCLCAIRRVVLGRP